MRTINGVGIPAEAIAISKRLVGMAVFLAAFGCGAGALAAGPASGIQTANMDRAARPQDDLFEYANGAWLRDTPIPADRSRWGVDSMMLEHSLVEQRTLAEAARTSGDPQARKVGDLYASFMDEARIERLGARPLDGEMERIAAVQSVRGLAPLMAHFDRIGVASPIGTLVEPDAKQSSRYALTFYESGVSLPERDYYLSAEPRFVEIRAKYRAHVAAMLGLLGDADAAREADDILVLETRLAAIQWKPVDFRDPQKTYNPRTLAEMDEMAPQIDWRAYLDAEGLSGPPPTLIVREPSYFSGLSDVMKTTPVAVWKAYLRYRLLSASAPYLPKAFADEDFAFSEGVLHGTPANSERWKRGCALVDQLLGDAWGKLYVEAYFPARSKARVDAMVGNVIDAYATSIETLDWMTPPTRAQALAKLRKMAVKVGYPDRWRDYGALAIAPDDLLGNVFRAQAFETGRKHAQLAGPVDRAEWQMTAPTVDAYYDAGTNELAFPAGVLQPPLFDPAADDAYNYGSTGATIGHELSHGFDNRGSQHDGDGNLRDWWTAQDHAAFKARTDRLVRQFDSFEPVAGYHVNGALTLSENIADLAGLEIAHKAYVASLHGRPAPVIDGLTGEQRFFVGYAQSYLGKQREALLIAQLKSNPHAPEADRVNGAVANMQAFYDAFGVKPGDRMYVAPEQRVRLW